MPQIKSCGVLVFRDEPVRSFLLMVHPTRWDLPKGHVDNDESEIECALRELYEETNIQATDIELDPMFRFTTHYPVRYKKKIGGRICEKTLVVFLGWLRHPIDVQVSEHQAFHWIAWNPPHKIQKETIDPLLAAVAEHFPGA